MPTDDPQGQATARGATRQGIPVGTEQGRAENEGVAQVAAGTGARPGGSSGSRTPVAQTTMVSAASLEGGVPVTGDPGEPGLGGEDRAPPAAVVAVSDPTTARSAPLPPSGDALGNYLDLGPLGQGGMGEVRRVWDATLGRTLALKVIHPGLIGRARARERFRGEARATAQLQHPGIVPIHEMGTLPDGRPYYTMKEVQGRTLQELIREAHGASESELETGEGDPARVRRLVEVFCRVCEAVAYAHARGVIHRDLKPENVMVGDFGEVLVLDWGLAKVLAGGEDAAWGGEDPPPREAERDDSLTRPGSVQGTPAYMSPEQARGETHRVGTASDVYALGCVLYQVLSGQAPYSGASAWAVLVQVNMGPPPPVAEVASRTGAPPVPEELQRIVARALDRDPDRRHPDAGALAREVAAWLDGALKREAALALVARADALAPEVRRLRERVAGLRAEAGRLLDGVHPGAPLDRKRPAWRLQDEAARLSREANVREVEYLQTLRAALVQVEDLPLAHDRLADLYRARLEAAESARDEVAAAESEALLRAHDRGRHAPWLRGDGALTLVTDPPAEVVLERYVEQDRRLVPVAERVLGRTPFHAVAVPRGSYRLRLRAEGRAEVLYPVLIGRGEHWDGVPPGGTEPWPVALPSPGDLGPDEVYVPAGWMVSGGDHSAKGALPHRRLWVDALVAERFPVTVGRYIEFLNDLVATGHEEEALRVAPRERGAGGAEGVLIFGRDGCGRFVIQSDADGDLWRPDWAMTMVGHGSATAYARWWAARRGMPCRLPGELEWEKVARGADGRFFPWGDFFDATWCLTHDTEAGGRMQLTVDAFPTDESPYGVRGMGGNVRDWCAEAYSRSGPPVAGERVVPPPAGGDGLPTGTIRTVRGGAWGGTELSSRAANRNGFAGDQNYPVFGFRLVRSFP